MEQIYILILLKIALILGYLIPIMLISNIIKDNNLFDSLYALLYKIKLKRLKLFLISLFNGILPIPGRVIISSAVLNTIAPCCSEENCNKGEKSCRKKRSKFGIIDYLSTHHYYLWSPLEKTVIIPMAVLGLSYITFLNYMYPIILITFAYIFYYIFFVIKEEDIELNINAKFELNKFLLYVMPFFIAIIAIIFFEPFKVFLPLLVYYIILTKDINFNINWKLIIFVSVVTALAIYFQQYSNEIIEYIKVHNEVLNPNNIIGLIAISSFLFVSTWLMGSSSKFAALTTLTTSIFGLKYFIFFFVIEYFAYNTSPQHKCFIIGQQYFGTPTRRYFDVIIKWQLILLVYAIYTIL